MDADHPSDLRLAAARTPAVDNPVADRCRLLEHHTGSVEDHHTPAVDNRSAVAAESYATLSGALEHTSLAQPVGWWPTRHPDPKYRPEGQHWEALDNVAVEEDTHVLGDLGKALVRGQGLWVAELGEPRAVPEQIDAQPQIEVAPSHWKLS